MSLRGPLARRALLVTTLVAAACALTGPRLGGGEELREILDRARTAMGRAAFAAGSGTWCLTGRSAGRRSGARFVDCVAVGGRFLRRTEGPTDRVRGYDGDVVWAVDGGAGPRTIGLDARPEELLEAWLTWGQWIDELDEDAIRVDRARSREGAVALELSLAPAARATVWIDEERALPASWEVALAGGVERCVVEGWRSPAGFALPRKLVVHGVAGASTELVLEDLEPASAAVSFAPPSDVVDPQLRFDAPQGELVVRPCRGGRMLVRASVDDAAEGWFLLDSGAGHGVIDAELADALDWPVVGELALVGAAGASKATWRLGGEVALGPMRRRGSRWAAFDLQPLARALDLSIDGILGHDLLARAVVGLDFAAGRAWVADPRVWPGAEGEPLPVAFDGTAACVRAAWEPDGEGWFRLDTGSDDTLAFHGPAAAQARRGVGRVFPVTVHGLGGAVHGWRGRLPAFEIAGQRVERLPVTFLEEAGGAFERPSVAGNLGVGVLRRFRVTFDFPRGRVWLDPRK